MMMGSSSSLTKIAAPVDRGGSSGLGMREAKRSGMGVLEFGHARGTHVRVTLCGVMARLFFEVRWCAGFYFFAIGKEITEKSGFGFTKCRGEYCECVMSIADAIVRENGV